MMAKRIKTVNKEMLKKTLRTGGCLQNFLHGRQPGLRKSIIYIMRGSSLHAQGAIFL